MRKLTVVGVLLLALLLALGACAPEPTPAKFEVTSLAVTPIVAEPGQAVTVEVEVANVGGTEGSHTLTLTVNGVEEETRDVTVAPGATETAAFTLVRDASGMYEIKVAGLTETLRVKQPGAYPRLGNFYAAWPEKTNSAYFLWHPQPKPTPELKSLAMYDIIAIPYAVGYYAPESIRQLRKLNPRIKILAFFPFGDSDIEDLKTVQSSNESWFLHYGNTPGSSMPPEQRRVSFMQDIVPFELWLMNPASEWSTYVPNYVHDNLMSTGLFDGVFYDCIWEWENAAGVNIDFNNIDINNDGIAESRDVVNREYKNGMTQLLQLTRELLGPEAIILGNPGAEWSANSPYFEYANGQFQEAALSTIPWSNHDFSKIWDIYLRNMQQLAPPSRIHWINAGTNSVKYDPFNPDLPPAELQKMRYGLAITLLDDGYFSFDEPPPWHCQLWWFPEYDTNLGFAMGDAQKRSDGSWMREFENGVVIANPTSKDSTIEFQAIYKDVTTGIEGTSFVVPP